MNKYEKHYGMSHKEKVQFAMDCFALALGLAFFVLVFFTLP